MYNKLLQCKCCNGVSLSPSRRECITMQPVGNAAVFECKLMDIRQKVP
jgi:hypothetical protein